jgi:hypothetical protein
MGPQLVLEQGGSTARLTFMPEYDRGALFMVDVGQWRQSWRASMQPAGPACWQMLTEHRCPQCRTPGRCALESRPLQTQPVYPPHMLKTLYNADASAVSDLGCRMAAIDRPLDVDGSRSSFDVPQLGFPVASHAPPCLWSCAAPPSVSRVAGLWAFASRCAGMWALEVEAWRWRLGGIWPR